MPRGVKAEPAEAEKQVEERDQDATGVESPKHGEPGDGDRTEEFERTRPDGSVVVISRNIDTGEQTVTEVAEPDNSGDE